MPQVIIARKQGTKTMGLRIFQLDQAGRRRIAWMYHAAFVILLAHFALVYLHPGYFYTPPSYAGGGNGHSVQNPANVKTVGDRRMLFGGDQPGQDFDITVFRLDPDQLHYGLGREAFPALIAPAFVTADKANQWLLSEARVLAVKVGEEVKVYPIDLLIRHEVVNDVVGGRPIFAAYCILADLGAVYDRKQGEHTLTFAVSGYTYADPAVWEGMDAFVLWDRETQSLWWPPIAKAVSGPLLDAPLRLLDETLWSQTTWGVVRQVHPHALVLEQNQDLDRPTHWSALELPAATTQPDAPAAPQPTAEPAPRWGKNQPW